MGDNSDISESILARAITLIIIGILLGIFIQIHENHLWNDGYHSCGGKWEYVQPIGHMYSTSFLYECDKCGATHEFGKRR